jgi:hypothetical protein
MDVAATKSAAVRGTAKNTFQKLRESIRAAANTPTRPVYKPNVFKLKDLVLCLSTI